MALEILMPCSCCLYCLLARAGGVWVIEREEAGLQEVEVSSLPADERSQADKSAQRLGVAPWVARADGEECERAGAEQPVVH